MEAKRRKAEPNPLTSTEVVDLLKSDSGSEDDAESDHDRCEGILSKMTDPDTLSVKDFIQSSLDDDHVLASHNTDSVKVSSAHTLQSGEWLNDEIINYYIKNCLANRDKELCSNDSNRKRSHFFSSFFAQKLFVTENGDPHLRGKYNYSNVANWGKKGAVPAKDIFDLKYIFIPINENNMHWVSAMVFMEEKKICWYNSLGGTDSTKFYGILQYLKDEWKAKRRGDLDPNDEWNFVRCSTADVPQQENSK